MNLLDRMIAGLAPERALRRAQARAALQVIEARYAAATTTQRGGSWRASGSDADAAASSRARLRHITRDMIRNTPLATRGQAVIVNNVIGDGIIPKVSGGTPRLRAQMLDLIERHLDTTAIDADGRCNLYGLQRLAMNAVVDAGEVLIRRRRRTPRDRLPLPFQLQMLEADYLDTSRAWATDEGHIREGIEYDAIGRRVAYWLYDEHPGAQTRRPFNLTSRRIPAAEIVHLYRQDRPGQARGVTWFAPVALALQDLADGVDAHLMRQKIAACFAGFITQLDADPAQGAGAGASAEERLESIRPGRMQRLQPGETITFAAPPGVEGFDEFARLVLRMAASGLGITYEALTGDLSEVNFSSARMGRMEMNRNVSAWQHLTVIPQMLDPIADWVVEGAAMSLGRTMPADIRLSWVAPTPIMVDPAREIAALAEAVRAGFKSRQRAIRELGFDPETVREEQIEDRDADQAAGLRFDTTPAAEQAPGLTEDGTGDGDGI
jgi:lambda family phage portal protein